MAAPFHLPKDLPPLSGSVSSCHSPDSCQWEAGSNAANEQRPLRMVIQELRLDTACPCLSSRLSVAGYCSERLMLLLESVMNQNRALLLGVLLRLL